MSPYSPANCFLSFYLVVVCVRKGYSIYSIIEHILFFVLCFMGLHDTYPFCFCISMKVLISLLFFVYETCRKLSPHIHHKQLDELQAKMYYSPCVVFVIPKFESTNLKQRLELCGKCQDWAVSAVYVLSCHKFLSYSVVAHVRWLSWVGCGMLCTFVYGDRGNNISNGLVLSDCILQLITLVDVENLKKHFKFDDGKAFSHLQRASYHDTLKLVVLCASIWFSGPFVPAKMHYFGYPMYLIICAACGVFVHFWTQSGVDAQVVLDSELSLLDDESAKKNNKKNSNSKKKNNNKKGKGKKI